MSPIIIVSYLLHYLSLFKVTKVAVRQMQNYIPAGRNRSLKQGNWLCVKSSVTKIQDANTMNSVVVATALVIAISIII